MQEKQQKVSKTLTYLTDPSSIPLQFLFLTFFRCDQMNCFCSSVIVKLMTHLNEDQNNFSSPSVRRAMSLKQNHAFDI